MMDYRVEVYFRCNSNFWGVEDGIIPSHVFWLMGFEPEGPYSYERIEIDTIDQIPGETPTTAVWVKYAYSKFICDFEKEEDAVLLTGVLMYKKNKVGHTIITV